MTLPDYTYREAEERDFKNIEALFRRQQGDRAHPEEWVEWKYRRSPDGPARVFVTEDSDGAIVGTVAYLPRRFTSADTGELRLMQGVDVFLHPDHRGKRVYLGLSRFAGRHMDVPRFGVPNASSRRFALSSGWRVLGPYADWVFPLQISEQDGAMPSRIVRPLVNLMCRVYRSFWLCGARDDVDMQPVKRFSRDYELNPDLIHGVRSAAYLNWRFVDNPRDRYFCYELVEGPESIGYCVYTRQNRLVTVADLVTTRHRRSSFRRLVDHCRGQGCDRIRFSGVGLQLRRLGFVHRGSMRDCTVFKVPEGRWLVTQCDTDGEIDYHVAGSA